VANHYIRAGAAGNGSDWDNAWPDFASASWTRGDTYYVADGTYNETVSCNTLESGTSVITIRKACKSGVGDGDHGTDVGWDDLYGDGIAIIQSSSGSVLSINSNYWVWDGVFSTFGTSNSYGFKIIQTSLVGGYKIVRLGTDKCSNIELKNIEMKGAGEDVDVAGQDGLYIAAVPTTPDNVLVQKCLIWDVCINIVNLSRCTNATFDYCVLAYRHTNDILLHGQGIQVGSYLCTGLVVKNCYFLEIYGTGGVVFLNKNTHTGAKIYNNVFYMINESRYYYSGGIVSVGELTAASNMEVHHNTVVDVDHDGFGRAAVYFQYGGTGNVAYNNIFMNCYSASFTTNVDHDFNLYDVQARADLETNGQYYSDAIGTLFVNPTGHDYHLLKATDAGYSLGSPYTVDFDGVQRGIDGSIDRGTYEYNANPAVRAIFIF
jgi:hypothetical protein